MKNTIVLAFLFIFGFTSAQTTRFSENFEGSTYSITSSGSSTWDTTSVYQANGNFSYEASITASGDTTILTTDPFATTGDNYVSLKFNHIAKLDLFDGGYIEVSANNGSTWTRLTTMEYKGNGYFGVSPNYSFSAAAYASVWNPVVNTLIPQNSWWRGETFDISSIIGNVSQAKVRFVLYGNNTIPYGWLIDDIEVSSSSNEMNPPSISLIQGYPMDTVYTTGPFDVFASITDASGIATAELIYEISGVIDTIPMSYVSFNVYKGIIPSQPYLTNICYRIHAIDSSANANENSNPAGGCISFKVKRDPNLPVPYEYDAATFVIESPLSQNPANIATPVIIRVANKGDSTLTKVNVGWSFDGVVQQAYSWTGSLSLDQVSDTLSLGNLIFQQGAHTIDVWTYSPNDTLDQNQSNDSLTLDFYVCDQILSGNYTLGGPTADFQSFQELVLGLNNCGINGAVTVTVNSGVYNEQVLFSDLINGLDSTNTLTIQSASNNASDVVLKYAPNATDNYVLGIIDASWITIKGITIEALAANTNAVTIYQASKNTINKCNIIAPQSASSNSYGISVEGAGSSNNTISNCELKGGYSALRFNGSFSARNIGNIAINNSISDCYATGIECFYQNNITIENNTIRKLSHTLGSTYVTGIKIQVADNFSIQNNTIDINLTQNGYGLFIAQTTASSYAKIYNNMIAVGGTSNSSIRAVNLGTVAGCEFYNNSISLYTGSSSATAAYIFGTTSVVDMLNNSFANFNGGYAMDNTSDSIKINDYNNYWTTGVNIVKWGSATALKSIGITGVQGVTLKDANSIVSDPNYYSNSNLHSYSTSLDSAGLPLLGIATDIDGDLRNTTSPDIGADEFTISTTDIGIIDILNVLPIDTQSRVVNLIAKIKNYGSQTVTSFMVKYALDGGAFVNVPWTGSIASGATDTVNLGTITLPVFDFNILASTIKTTDTLTLNDSLIKYYYALPLIDAEMVSLINPQDGCEKGANETVEVKIKNQGLIPIYNGLTASYNVNGSATTVTENVTDTIPVGGEIVYTFAQKVNMITGYQDSIFNFNLKVHHNSDPINSNDSTVGTVVSQGELLPPQISDTNVFYGNSIMLTANSNDPVYWYNNDSTPVSFNNGSTYTTPLLFDTTTYYVQASLNNPPSSATIGFASTTTHSYEETIYGRTWGAGAGKSQILYTAAELLASGLTAGELESIEFHVDFTYSNCNLTDFSVSLANVTNTSLTTSFISTGLTLVHSAPFTLITQVDKWYTHTFTNPFIWDGTSNLLIQVCTQGNVNNSAKVVYTSTSFNSFVSTIGVCSNGSGTITNNRPNIKIHRKGSLGCSSARVPFSVDVPLPTIDANLSELIEPTSGCGLNSTPVTISIVNNGIDTIPAGINATYKIGNNSYITPEIVALPIAPSDTLEYTFNTLASLPSGVNGTSYIVTSKIVTPNDNYIGNDSLVVDSIMSNYTPSNPITSTLNINYANSATLSATYIDSLFWYADSVGTQLLGIGNGYVTDPLFDTTTYYAQEQRTIPIANYQVGTGYGNTSTTGPSPYGAANLGAKNQILIKASELTALGMIQGPIHSISFYVMTSASTPLNNYTISMGQTGRNSMLGSYLETGLTQVYSASSYSETVGWNEHQFSTPFFWDGYSNIIIESCFKNSLLTPFTGVRYTTTSYTSVAAMIGGNSFNCNDSTITSNSTKRPNIKLKQTGMAACGSHIVPLVVNVNNYPTIDAGLVALIEPSGSVSSTTPSTIKVVVRNFGLNTMTNATIKWTEKGVIQNTYNWSGSLVNHQTDTVVLSTNHLFKGGDTKLKFWVELTGDNISINDTIYDSLLICMSGSYVINQNMGDYHSISEAIDDLNIVGVCGPVIFNIDSGSYFEKATVSSVNGTSSTNTITFQSTQLDSSKVVINSTTNITDNYVIRIAGASHFIFKHLTVQSIGSQYGHCIVLENGASNLKFSNNILQSTMTSATSSKSSGIYTLSVGVSDIDISNNSFIYGYNSIRIQGASSNLTSNIRILNNSFNTFNGSGIYLTYCDSVEVSENQLNSGTQGGSIRGIYFTLVNNFEILKNKIIIGGAADNTGMYLRGNGNASQHSLIANNFVSIIGGVGTNEGMRISLSQYIDFYYNSIDISVGGLSTKAFYLNNTTNSNIKNNTFASAIGYALYSNTLSSSLDVDYNNYYTNNATTQSYVFWGTAVTDLNALKINDPNNHQHCLETDPYYISPLDLHAQQIDLYNSGTPIIGITTDIDGDLRNTNNPSIGADEFTPSAIDLSTKNLAYPQYSDCGFGSNDSIVVIIKNAGLNTLDFSTSNATIIVIVGGIKTDTIVYTLNSGTLASGNELYVKVINNYNLSLNGEYLFDASVSIQNDGNPLNDMMMPLSVISYPNINSFPFSEDFESGSNITLKEESAMHSKISTSTAAAYQSIYGLHFEGGGSAFWTNPSNVTQAFNNTEHIASATSCNIDATNLNSLYFQLNLRQTKYTTSGNSTSWFRVMLIDVNNVSQYLKTIDGDSVFVPNSANLDTAKQRIYDLTSFVGQNFKIKLEASCFRSFAYGSYSGDNVFVDNIELWEPSAVDVAVKKVWSTNLSGEIGSTIKVKTQFANFGKDTLYAIPLAYQAGTGSIIRDTAYGVYPPFANDSFIFVSQHTLTAGIENLCVFAEHPLDIVFSNDTSCIQVNGMNTYTASYATDFETNNDWFNEGILNQWDKGLPNTNFIDTAYSGTNAWVTVLSGNHKTGTTDFLYSPYFIIPTYADTALLEFYMTMNVYVPNAYGQLEVSLNGGITWGAIGYIAEPSSTNWYNLPLNGKHVWSLSNYNWAKSSINLDPAVFNTGNPFQLRFSFTGGANPVSPDGWAIDDFKITIPPQSTDVGISKIVSPIVSTIVGDSITVKVIVKNFGTDTITTIPLEYTINGSTVGSEVWNGVLYYNQADTFTFTTKYHTGGLGYQLCSYTSLMGDLINQNDTSCNLIVASPGKYDAGISQLIAPSNHTSIGMPTTVKVTIRNYGTEELSAIPVEYLLNGNSKANEIFNDTIAGGDSAEYTFTTTYISPAGNYGVCAQTNLLMDVNPDNDQQCATITGTAIESSLGSQFVVKQNIPNPSNSNTTIEFFIPKSGKVHLKVMNTLGAVIYKSEKAYYFGDNNIKLNTGSYESGIYYYSVSYEGIVKTFKVVVLH